jgi:hypothetical protein
VASDFRPHTDDQHRVAAHCKDLARERGARSYCASASSRYRASSALGPIRTSRDARRTLLGPRLDRLRPTVLITSSAASTSPSYPAGFETLPAQGQFRLAPASKGWARCARTAPPRPDRPPPDGCCNTTPRRVARCCRAGRTHRSRESPQTAQRRASGGSSSGVTGSSIGHLAKR